MESTSDGGSDGGRSSRRSSHHSKVTVVGDNPNITVVISQHSTCYIKTIGDNPQIGFQSSQQSLIPYEQYVQQLCEKRPLSQNGTRHIARYEPYHQIHKRERRRRESNLLEVSVSINRKKKRNHNRLRRIQQNLKRSTDSSDDEIRNIRLTMLDIQDDSTSLLRGLEIFHDYSTRLQPLRDNGQWGEFYRLSQKLLNESDDPTRKSIILLEESVALSYQKDLELSEEIIKKAATEIEKTNGWLRRLLEVVYNCYLSGLNRRNKKFGKSQRCLDRAWKDVEHFPQCLPLAIFFYEKAGLKLELAAIGFKEKSADTEASQLMQSCIVVCDGLDTQQVYDGKRHFAQRKIALIKLQCETSASRNEKVDEDSILEAERSLTSDDCDQKEVPLGAKILQLKGMVDLHFCKRDFAVAEQIALEGLELAKKLGFNLEKKALEERLEDIRRKMAESPRFRENSDMTSYFTSCTSAESSKTNTPISSENELDARV